MMVSGVSFELGLLRELGISGIGGVFWPTKLSVLENPITTAVWQLEQYVDHLEKAIASHLQKAI